MVPQPPSPQQGTAFPASQIPRLLRAIADPEGSGKISPANAALIRQVEANLTRVLGLAR